MIERKTNPSPITTRTSEQPDFPEGFLLFDMQVVQLKEWRAFGQTPEIVDLK